MSDTLAQKFGSSRTTKWQGETLHSVVELPAKEGDRITITRLASSTDRAQAIKIAVDKGNLRVNGLLVPSVAIWSHSAPEVVEVDVVGKRARSIDVWNAWSSDGVDSSWLANAAIQIEDHAERGWTLRCSDGVGAPSFDDLVVQISVKPYA